MTYPIPYLCILYQSSSYLTVSIQYEKLNLVCKSLSHPFLVCWRPISSTRLQGYLYRVSLIIFDNILFLLFIYLFIYLGKKK